MKTIKILLILLVMLSLIACSFTVNVPSIRTGATQTLQVSEDIEPDTEVSLVTIEMGAGELNLYGGSDKLVEGTVLYNVEAWKPVITRDGSSLNLSQKTNADISIPDGNYKNEWNLKLGSTPIDLSLMTGAYKGNLDLSGVPITRLSVADGASSSKIRFDSLNPVAMSELSYNTGASEVEVLGIGNANVTNVNFDSGVGSFTLDFSGENPVDINVSITSGMSDLKLILPDNVMAKVIVNGELNNIDLQGTWTVEGSTYTYGSVGSLVTITVDMAVGNLQLIQQ